MAVESLGRVLGTSRIAVVSRKSLDTSRIALQSLGRDQQDSWEISRTSLRPSRMAVQFHGRDKGIDGVSPSVFRFTSTWECNEVPK